MQAKNRINAFQDVAADILKNEQDNGHTALQNIWLDSELGIQLPAILFPDRFDHQTVILAADDGCVCIKFELSHILFLFSISDSQPGLKREGQKPQEGRLSRCKREGLSHHNKKIKNRRP